jgi:putative acetyltransferase
MTIAIRPATTADLAAVRDVHRQAFGGRPNEAYLVELLHAAGNAPVSLVATVDGNVVGHVLFSEVSLSPPGPAFQAVGLAPVGVLPAYQRQGIGARLIRAGLGAARAAGYRAAVVLGSPAYCGRFGFVRAAGYGLENEYGADADFMVLTLGDEPLPVLRGMVRYAPEFAVAGC